MGDTLHIPAVGVTNGLFTITLDFGTNVITGDARWLHLSVRTNGAPNYTPLSPRQPLTPLPYALYAPNAASAATAVMATTASTALSVANKVVTAEGIAVNQVVKSLNALHDQVTLSAGTNINLTADGNNISISATPGTVVTNTGWSISGNSGTTLDNFLGTTDGRALELRVNNARALRLVPTADTPNLIGGYSGNRIAQGIVGGTIGGGGTVLGTQPNIITNNGQYGTIAGGYNNTVTNYGGAVLGGSVNFDGGYFGAIGAGQFHTNLGDYSWIGGGQYNVIQATADYSTVGGGYDNRILAGARSSSIGSGEWNVIGTNALYSTIAGGSGGTIGSGAAQSTIAGGYANQVFADSTYASIGGGRMNAVGPRADYSTIAGGFNNQILDSASISTVAGGLNNQILTGSTYASIGGGYENVIGPRAVYSTIGGGRWGTIGSDSVMSTIAGGYWQTIGASADTSTIGGGQHNTIQDTAKQATIAGGTGNTINAGAYGAVVSGGDQNVVQANAYEAVVAGGLDNQIGSGAFLGSIGGGTHNRVKGPGGTIPGGNSNAANGVNTFGAGTQAKAVHNGAFVWADYNYVDFTSTAPNQFLIRAGGGVGINTAAPQQNLSVAGGMNIDQADANNGTAASVLTFGSASGEGIGSKRTAGGNRFGLDFYTGSANRMTIANSGSVGIGTTAPVSLLHVNGEATVKVLTILGGADVAEPFDIVTSDVPKGSVVIIDPEHPGKLKLSDRAYDTRVAGVVSGANGVQPGLSLRQGGVLEGGQNVALGGRVYVQAEARNGAIQPGDLLTTSATPGHAMKVTDHTRAQGAILGKAMSALGQGRGLVLVLVTLQ